MKRRATRGETEFTGGQGSNLRLFVIICVFVVAGVLIAWMLAPEKPEAPAASNISYEAPPERTASDAQPSETQWPAMRREEAQAADEETEKLYAIAGRVISGEDGSFIAGARINASRVLTQEELEAAQELNVQGDKKAYIAALDAAKETAHAVSDENGEFTIGIAKSGTYNLSAIHNAYLDKHENGLLVAEDAEEPFVELELVTGAKVTGKIFESDSRFGVEGITIRSQGPSIKHIESSQDGTYVLSGLKPGAYEISLTLRGTPYQVRGRVPIKNVQIDYPDEVIPDVDFGVAAAGTVWGYIKDYEGEPIENMQAILVSSESIFSQAIDAAVKKAPPIADSSDEEGYYALYGVPLDREWRVHAMSDELTPQLSDPFIVTSTARSARVDLFIVDGSTVSGRVIDSATGAPVVGSQVVCIPQYSRLFAPVDKPQAFRDGKSDDNGYFTFLNLPEGDYQVMAHADGYKVVTQGKRIEPDGIQDISNVVIKLTPVGMGDHTVFGVVRDSQGRPIEGARLELTTVSTFGTSAANSQSTSDNRGRFEFVGIDTGFLILNASAEGYSNRVVQQVRFDEETTVVLESLSGISGRVTVRETGQPVGTGGVTAIPIVSADTSGFLAIAAAAERSSSSIAPDGAYTLNLPPGRYTVQARATGFTPSSVVVDAVEGESQTGVDIQISSRGGSISGRVRTADSTTPLGAIVQINNAAAQAVNAFGMAGDIQASNVAVDTDGAFEFEQLPAGPYTVTARLDGYAPRISPVIVIEEFEERDGVELVLTQGGSVQGYVLDDGDIQVGAVVSAVGNGVNQTTASDANGQYRLDQLPPGEYLLSTVSLEDPNLRNMFAPRHATVVVEEGVVTTHNFGDESGTRIEGYVSPPPPDGQLGFAMLVLPGAGDQVLALNMTNPLGWFTGNVSGAGSMVMGMSAVAADGSFVIDDAPPGTHELLIVYANLGSIMANVTEVAAQQVIDVQPGEPMQIQIQAAP